MQRLDPRPSIELARIPCWMRARVFARWTESTASKYTVRISPTASTGITFRIRMTRWCATLACRKHGESLSPLISFNGDAMRFIMAHRSRRRSMTEPSYDRISIAQEYFRRADAGRADIVELMTEDVQLYFPKYGIGHGKKGLPGIRDGHGRRLRRGST